MLSDFTDEQIQEILREKHIDPDKFDYRVMSIEEWLETPMIDIMRFERVYKNQIYMKNYMIFYKFKRNKEGVHENKINTYGLGCNITS